MFFALCSKKLEFEIWPLLEIWMFHSKWQWKSSGRPNPVETMRRTGGTEAKFLFLAHWKITTSRFHCNETSKVSPCHPKYYCSLKPTRLMTQSSHEETSVTKRQDREERDLAVASESARNLLDECREATRNTKRVFQWHEVKTLRFLSCWNKARAVRASASGLGRRSSTSAGSQPAQVAGARWHSVTDQ